MPHSTAEGIKTTRLSAAVTTTALIFLLAFSAPALATTGHTFAGSFGGQGEAEGQFSNPISGLGVGLSGDVYVSEPGSNRIQRFDAAGSFQSVIPAEGVEELGPVAVDSAPAGGLYLPGFFGGVPSVVKRSAAGAFEYTLDPGLSETSFYFGGRVAVDPSDGTVYASAANTLGAVVIDSFSQTTGAFIGSWGGETGSPDGPFVCFAALAVDTTHHVYILDSCKGRVDRYSATGTWEATVDDGTRGAPQAIATDPTTGELYVAEAGPAGLQITDFDAATGAPLDTFSAANVAALAGLAVGPDATVYVADNANFEIDRFAPFAGPTVTTEPTAEVGRTSATFMGTVNPEGIASKYHYEYGLDTTYGSVTEPLDAGSGNSAEAAPGPITGLVPNTLYHYRIVGTNASGSIVGPDQTLTTEPAPPHVDGAPAFASAITPTGALAHATVDPEHSPTTFRIEYGTTTAYGSTAPEGGTELGEQSSDQAVATTLSGLQPGTEYHFRVSAENGIEEAQTGADATFITAPAAPATAAEVTTRQATLTGTIDPHGAPTTYHFDYGLSTAYGASTSDQEGGSGSGEEAVTAHIAGLLPGTTYHVQVIATTNGITRAGADGTFTTAPAPTAKVSDPTAVTTASATLQGTADTHGQPGTYHFELEATEGGFSTSTPEQPLSATSGPQSLSVPVSGLPSGQSLTVRLVVSSNEVRQVSDPVTFATAPQPPEGFPPPPAPASLYGCTAPHLNPVNQTVKPGATITVSGSDLGLAGRVLLGEDTLLATGWSAAGFTIEVPPDATGTLGLTVNCGHASNTVALTTTGVPSNAFTLTGRTVKGATATLTLELPGPGTLQVSGSRTRTTAVKVTGAGTQTVHVTLSRAGARALAKAKRRRLAVRVRISFTPTGGSAAAQIATVTFKRKGGR